MDKREFILKYLLSKAVRGPGFGDTTSISAGWVQEASSMYDLVIKATPPTSSFGRNRVIENGR